MASVQEPQLDELRRRARRRLIGAIVLALAAAVVVPMLLESDPKPLGEDVSVRIPPVDDGRFVNQLGEKRGDGSRTGTPETTAAAPPPAPPPAAAPSPPATPPATPPVTESPAADVAAKPPAAAKDAAPGGAAKALSDAERKVISPPVPTPRATDRTEAPKADVAKAAPKSEPLAGTARPEGAWSVQLAAFADDKGANALAGKLRKAGHPAYTEPYSTSRGTLWRVRVGPYPSRDAAEAARTRLKADGQSGIITAAK
jgi:DedD protein